ncbi:16S rRNA methyltransferase [Candidatus Leptofilum sp.]|uniref:16S rRNA methyltransferase n=1 Tax=Candidatus Leptofilum sp. TaxID=3241576 RepID=UPI003B5AB2CB
MPELERLTAQILASSKYREIAPDLVRRIGAQELEKRRSLKEAVKATKNKLHQVGGAYQQTKLNYEKSLEMLRETAVSHPNFRTTCHQLMQAHASTRERLLMLDEFYQTILANLPPIHTVLDLACGLNPLAYPWLPLPKEVQFTAVDIYSDMLNFIQAFFEIARINGRTQQRDIIGNPPTDEFDLILLLKTLPCLEQVDKNAAANLVGSLNGRYLLISYPTQSLGGRGKGMVENYTQQFQALANGRNWRVQRFEFATELAFLVQTELRLREIM